MRIASVIRPESVNANYRARIPLLALGERGHEHQLFDAHELPHLGMFRGFDVVHFCRLWEEPFQYLARALRDEGIGVTWDCDDNLPAIERDTESFRLVGGHLGPQVARDLESMMEIAHVVTTPSHGLVSDFERIAADVRLIENYLAPPMVLRILPPRINPKLRIGWVAGDEHMTDVARLRIRETILRILAYHPQVEFIFVGFGLGLEHPRYHRIPGVELLELPSVIAQFDIGIAPLSRTPFNRGRSNIKIKEYAVAGTPWLATDLDPYHDLGEDQGGRLINNDEWERALLDLIGDGNARRQLAARARAWGKLQDIMFHLHEWESTFEDAIAIARGEVAGNLGQDIGA
ncbi:MAG: hypothetical protein ABUL56_03535 [Actinomycetota bacterium]